MELKGFTRQHTPIFAILLLLAPLSELPRAVSVASPTGVLVPLYCTSGGEWDPVIDAKIAHPAVPIVAIINSCTDRSSPDPSYATLTQRLQSVGIIVIGYIHTSYASRNSSDVKADIDNYKSWYNVDGVFLDEMAHLSGGESYYSNLTSYSRSKGLTLVVGNPGTETSPSYVGTVDSIVIYENAGLPEIPSLGGWHTNYDKKNWGILPYAVNSLDKSCLHSASSYVGYIYMTNGTYPYNWSILPPYFTDLVATLDPGYLRVSLTIRSATLSGSEITGYWTTIQSCGAMAATGFTSLSYAVPSGTTYMVTVADYGNYLFDHWLDTNSTNRNRNLSIFTDTQITAVYRDINNPPPSQSTISVSTANSAGNAISGYYTTFWQGGTMLYSCFSPCSYLVANGQTYQIAVADYGDTIFSHWSDGTTSRFNTVTIGSTSTKISLTAIYAP